MRSKMNVPVRLAAAILGKSDQFIRVGLQREKLNFGTALKMSSVYTYHISPKLFAEYSGINENDLLEMIGGD